MPGASSLGMQQGSSLTGCFENQQGTMRTTTWLWVGVQIFAAQMPWELCTWFFLAPQPFFFLSSLQKVFCDIPTDTQWLCWGKNDNLEHKHRHRDSTGRGNVDRGRLLKIPDRLQMSGCFLSPKYTCLDCCFCFFMAANLTPCKGVRYRKGLDLLSLGRVLLPGVIPQSLETQPQTWAGGAAQASMGCVNHPLFALGPQGRGRTVPPSATSRNLRCKELS